MTNPDQLLPAEITVRISDIKDQLRLHRLQGHEGLGVLFEYQLDLVNWDESDIVRDHLAPEGCLGPEAFLGKSLTVALPLAEQKTRHINGLVTQAAFRESIDHHTAYSVTIRPQLWLLTLRQNCRVFQNTGVLKVAQEILEEHGVAVRFPSPESTRIWDTLTQYRETDFEFLNRVLAHEGFYYFFEHGADGHTLVLADSASAHREAPQFQAIPIGKPKPIAGSDEHLMTWQAGYRLQTEAVTLADFDFRLRGQATKVLGPAEKLKKTDEEGDRPPREIYDFPAGCVLSENQEEATGQASPADSRVEAARLAAVRRDARAWLAAGYEGKGTVRWLAAGMVFSVEGCDSKKFLATHVELTLRNPAFLTSETTIDEPCEMAVKALDSTTPFRMAATDKPRILGPQTAWVVGADKEEISTDKYGRIQVHFHWDRRHEFEKNSSCWVRVAQPWAGNRWGAFSIPRVGSEVVVEFLYGDPDRPLVTGSVYGGGNLPPYDLPKHKTRSGIKTRSSKGANPDNFNEIRFEDKKGQEELRIQAERDLTALVKHDQSVTINGKRDITVKNGDNLLVAGSDKSARVEGSYEILANRLFNLLVGKGNVCSALSPTCCLDLRDGVVTAVADLEIKLVCGKASLSLKEDGTIEMTGTHLKLAGSDLIEANGKDATLSLHESIEAEGTQVSVTGKGEVHVDGAGARLDLTGPETKLTGEITTIKGQAVNVNC